MRWLALLCLWSVPATADVCVIVAEEAKTVRRIVIPDHDDQIPRTCLIGKGEQLLVIQSDALTDVDAAVEKATGVRPRDAIAAVIKDGVVEAVISADPKIDSVAGLELVEAYKGVAKGDVYSFITKEFVPPDGVPRQKLILK